MSLYPSISPYFRKITDFVLNCKIFLESYVKLTPKTETSKMWSKSEKFPQCDAFPSFPARDTSRDAYYW